jgi:hypothetical protein
MTATALTDAETANTLCGMLNKAVSGAGDAAAAAAAADVLSHIHPDLHAAVLDVAAAQPPGCQLDWSGASEAITELEVLHDSWCKAFASVSCARAVQAGSGIPVLGRVAMATWQYITPNVALVQ